MLGWYEATRPIAGRERAAQLEGQRRLRLMSAAALVFLAGNSCGLAAGTATARRAAEIEIRHAVREAEAHCVSSDPATGAPTP